MSKEKTPPPPQRFTCEICGKETEAVSGCYRCGRLMCEQCEAAQPEDEAGEPVCEECF